MREENQGIFDNGNFQSETSFKSFRNIKNFKNVFKQFQKLQKEGSQLNLYGFVFMFKPYNQMQRFRDFSIFIL